MTRVPRTSLSPDAIKLIVCVLEKSVHNLDVATRPPTLERDVVTCRVVVDTIQAVIDACTEEPKP